MNIFNLIYTWETSKGELSILRGNEYKLSLRTRENELFEIPKENICGLPEKQPNEITAIAQQYLPMIKNENGKFIVTFHFSGTPSNTELCDPSDVINKHTEFGFSFNKLESSFLVEFSATAPFYRKVIRGLNLEGSCEFNNCKAFKRKVCIPVGMGKFNIPQTMNRSICPACDTKLDFKKITNLGFWECNYSIDGRFDEHDVKKNDIAPSTKYKTFKPGDNCIWAYLDIEVTPLAQEPEANGGCMIF